MKQILLSFSFFAILGAKGQITGPQVIWVQPPHKEHKYVHIQYWRGCEKCQMEIDTAGMALTVEEALGRMVYTLTLRLDSLQSKVDSLEKRNPLILVHPDTPRGQKWDF